MKSIKPDDVAGSGGFPKGAESFGIAVRVGVALKIGEIAPVGRRDAFGKFGIDAFFGGADLIGDGRKGRGKFAGASGGAKGAPAGAQGAVPIGTGAATGQGEFIDLGAEAGFEFVGKREIVHGYRALPRRAATA